MAATTDFKRLFLRGLKWDGETAGTTLAETLKSAAQAKLTETGSGKVLIHHSGNGFTSTYALPSGGDGLTPSDAACLCEEMLRRYDEAVAVLAEGATDDEIFTEMLSQLAPVRSHACDFSQLSPV